MFSSWALGSLKHTEQTRDLLQELVKTSTAKRGTHELNTKRKHGLRSWAGYLDINTLLSMGIATGSGLSVPRSQSRLCCWSSSSSLLFVFSSSSSIVYVDKSTTQTLKRVYSSKWPNCTHTGVVLQMSEAAPRQR